MRNFPMYQFRSNDQQLTEMRINLLSLFFWSTDAHAIIKAFYLVDLFSFLRPKNNSSAEFWILLAKVSTLKERKTTDLMTDKAFVSVEQQLWASLTYILLLQQALMLLRSFIEFPIRIKEWLRDRYIVANIFNLRRRMI